MPRIGDCIEDASRVIERIIAERHDLAPQMRYRSDQAAHRRREDPSASQVSKKRLRDVRCISKWRLQSIKHHCDGGLHTVTSSR
jgi:hypothetical protein